MMVMRLKRRVEWLGGESSDIPFGLLALVTGLGSISSIALLYYLVNSESQNALMLVTTVLSMSSNTLIFLGSLYKLCSYEVYYEQVK